MPNRTSCIAPKDPSYHICRHVSGVQPRSQPRRRRLSE